MLPRILISIHYTLPIILNSLYQKSQDAKKIDILKTLALYYKTNICMVHFLVLNISYLKQENKTLLESTFKTLFIYIKNAREQHCFLVFIIMQSFSNYMSVL